MSEPQPTSVRFSTTLKADLKKFAKAQGCSVTWLINKVMGDWVIWKLSLIHI